MNRCRWWSTPQPPHTKGKALVPSMDGVARSGDLGEDKTHLPLPGIKPLIVQLVAQSSVMYIT